LKRVTVDQPQTTSEVRPLIAECTELVAMLTASIRKLRIPDPTDGASK
jgi:hypothetical protein